MNILELPLKRIVMVSLLIYSGNHLCAQTECTEMDRETKISNLTKEYGGIPIITFDGKEISLDEYVNMPSGKIGTVLGYGGSVANSYFGEIGKRGVMCLYSQENYRPNSSNCASVGDIVCVSPRSHNGKMMVTGHATVVSSIEQKTNYTLLNCYDGCKFDPLTLSLVIKTSNLH